MVLFMGSFATVQTKPFAIQDIDSLMQEQPKPILILLSTDWCKYCQMQKKQLEKNKDFLKQSDDFYYVIFNAEQKEPIVFQSQLFSYRAIGQSSGIHELAIALNGSENIAFPTWILLDTNYEVLLRYGGVISPKQVKNLLNIIDKSKKE